MSDDQPAGVIEQLEGLRLSFETERAIANEQGDDESRRYHNGKVVAVQSCIDIVRRSMDAETDQ